MLLYFLAEPYAPWLAPYAFSVIILGFLFFVFKLFENWYGQIFNKPLFRNVFIYKKLSASQINILKTDFAFYNKLSEKHKKQFEHRVVQFISEKKFIGRQDLVITDRIMVLVAAMGCMLSFGRKNYEYTLIEYILIYPDVFFSTINNNYHKGEFNPRERALVLSWKDFEKGFQITNDNLNVGIHEFMHAMQLEAKKNGDLDSLRFSKQFKNIISLLMLPEVKNELEKTQFFRSYAFTNQYEFMAVLAEYFFESPQEFRQRFPKIYKHFKTLLNFNFAGF